MVYFTRLMLAVLGVLSLIAGIGQFIDLDTASASYSGAVGENLEAIAFAWLGSGIVGWAVLWFFSCVLRELESIRSTVTPLAIREPMPGAPRAGEGWLTEDEKRARSN